MQLNIPGGGFKDFLFSPRKLGKIPILTNIFQMDWNHQLVYQSHGNPIGLQNYLRNLPGQVPSCFGHSARPDVPPWPMWRLRTTGDREFVHHLTVAKRGVLKQPKNTFKGKHPVLEADSIQLFFIWKKGPCFRQCGNSMCPALFGCYPPYETKIAASPLKIDGWKTIRLPFGGWAFFSGANWLLVSGRVTVAQLHAIPGQDQRIWHLWTSTPWVVHHVPVLWGPCCNRCRFFFIANDLTETYGCLSKWIN